ncbi:MAG: NTP transferase domain-containing protein [Planctomycetes bacterium]|nr:NTP transferase domain-containing protein [Planctomycetota bacterium]
MSKEPMIALIMAGGSGTRFWPLSVAEEPKQFLHILGTDNMLQATWNRLDGLVPPEHRLVVTSEHFAERTRRYLPGLPTENLIGEPEQRDTAAVAILGAALIERRWPGATVMVLPSDHLIQPAANFRGLAAATARMVREENVLCTVGVRPLYPSSGYGYIERDGLLDREDSLIAFRVNKFTEKPDTETARQYLRRGSYYWNAGIFFWKASVLLEEAREHMPEHHHLLTQVVDSWGTTKWPKNLRLAYSQLQKISVDFGIMEKTTRAAVVEANFKWSDLGGWIALGEQLAQDGAGNDVHGQVVLRECQDSVVYNEALRGPVICIGVRDMVVAHTTHGVLVCHKDRVEQIKAAVGKLYERHVSKDITEVATRHVVAQSSASGPADG